MVKRRAARVIRDVFPSLLPEQIAALARHYDIPLAETQRIAGSIARRRVRAQGRPALRPPVLGRRATGLLLKRADAVNEAGRASSSSRSPTFDRRRSVDPRHGRARRHEPPTGKWRIEAAGAVPAQLPGWVVAPSCPGSTRSSRLTQAARQAASRWRISCISDGLVCRVGVHRAARQRPSPATGLASRVRSISTLAKLDDHMITVIGRGSRPSPCARSPIRSSRR